MKRVFFYLFFFLPLTTWCQNTGAVNGVVRDVRTLAPIQNATLKIPGTDFNTITDSLGFYRFTGVPTQTYSFEVTATGYQTQRKFDITITSGNIVELNFELEEQYKQLTGIEVKAGYIKPVGVLNSVQTLGINEIAKYPGANFDIAKVVQSLPGVSGSVGFRNDIIIRGGAPNENVYYLDGVEIPTINHFATQGAAGGPVGMLNVSFIEGVTLHTSAFPARYDNPLSGVLQFKQRTGNAQEFQGNFRLSASEVALTGEGPLGKKNSKTTFMASVRRSYLQLLFQLIDLPFLPDYWDYQYKVTHKLNPKNEINLIGIGSIDNFTFKAPKNPTLEQMAILDQIPVNTQRTNTMGVSWRHTLKKGYMLTVLSHNRLTNNFDKFENNEEGNESKRILKYRSLEEELRFRFEYSKSLGKWQFNSGLSAIESHYENSTFQRRTGFVTEYGTHFRFLRYGLFVQAGRKFFDNRLNVNAGLRADGNTFMTAGQQIGKTISPRISLAYALTREVNINLSAGRYYKIPPYTVLGFKENNNYVNKATDYIQSDHLVTGLEWIPASATRITLEGFYKKYSNYPVSFRNGISLANLGGDFGVLGNERVTSSGKGKAYGLELMMQQRLTKHFYGILAYTYYYSLFTGTDGKTFIPSAWDNRHLLSFTGGYKFQKNWELGVRFRYQGNAPATPYDIDASLNNYPFTNQAVLDFERLNTLRLRAFNATDIRLDKKWNFKKWSLDVFLDIQNALNSKNPTQDGFTLQRNSDGSYATSDGSVYNPGAFNDPALPNTREKAIPVLLSNNSGSRVPTIGFVVEF